MPSRVRSTMRRLSKWPVCGAPHTAQFERDLIRAGLEAAQSRGPRGGRQPVITEDKLKRARELIAKGLTVRETAARIRVSKTALYKALVPAPVS